jgi:hypothetical protein
VNGNDAACRDAVNECVGQADGYRFCRDNVAHACSADWASTSATQCQGETTLCIEGQCVACRPESQRCDGDVPERCSELGVWEKQAPCAAPNSKCVFGRCEAPTTIGTACRPAGQREAIDVEWVETSTPTGLGYQVRVIAGNASASGWTLHHRKTAGAGASYFDADVVVTDQTILGYVVERALMPSAGSYSDLGDPPLSVLTCPDGTCVASPARNECLTVYDHSLPPGAPRPPRIAVVGDELVRQNESCRGPLPLPDFCAPSLEDRLQKHGYSSWISHHVAQEPYAWLHVVREQATTRPDVLVIAVANYELQRILVAPVAERAAARDFARQSLHAAIGAVRAANPEAGIVLVTVSERGAPTYRDEAKLLNRMIWRVFEERTFGGNLFVAGWEVLAVATCGEEWQSEGAPPCSIFDADQLHLRGAGDDLRNDLILFAVATALKPDN